MSGKGAGKVIVVGAGVAGLTLACRLASAGRDVTVIEREPSVGGLARSFRYGGHVFDIGPHRFYTEKPDISAFIRETLGDFLTVRRRSAVWMFGKYVDWPLGVSALGGMPPAVVLKVVRDFLRRQRTSGPSFEDYILSRYGRTLYEIFFRPYTEKFLGLPCRDVSWEWAVTGIERSLIDRRMDSLWGLAKSLLSAKPPMSFIYPASGGISVFSERLTARAEAAGAAVVLAAPVTGIAATKGRVEGVVAGGRAYGCDLLVWTGPIPAALSMLSEEIRGLEYLSMLLFNYRLAHPPLTAFQWCYYGSADIPFNRVSVPSLFNPALAPEGESGLCVEVTCRAGDRRWGNPHSIEPAIREALAEVGVLGGRGAVLGVNVERVAEAYPVYSLGFAGALEDAVKRLRKYENLMTLGRTGTFWYNNMDHSVGAAMQLAEELS